MGNNISSCICFSIFIWVVAVSWQNGDKDKFNILEEANQQLSSEDLIDIERSFS